MSKAPETAAAAYPVSAAPPSGAVEFRETGKGTAVVLAPGSCSTGAAWRPVIARLTGVRAITTSLCGYGGTAERRSAADASISAVAGALEEVIAAAGEPVHLVGHSFGGLTALAVALRANVPLLSLTIFEAPAVGLLRGDADRAHFEAIRRMTEAYEGAFQAGVPDAIATMIDFYGGGGCWAAMPEAVQRYAIRTTAVNLLDWGNAYAFQPGRALGQLGHLPMRVVVGQRSHPAIIRSNLLIAEAAGATFLELDGASHFMPATHPAETAEIIRVAVSAPPLGPRT